MKGIFINEDGGVRYAWAIVSGLKTIETRSRNMLSALVGERVAIIRTHRHSNPDWTEDIGERLARLINA